MIKRVLIVLSAAVMLISGAMFTVSAQDGPTPEEIAISATETRQALFKLFIFNLRPIAGMAQGAPFDAAIAERNARRIAAMAPMIPELLAADTRGFDVETEALDLIWDNQDDIAVKAQALVDNATAFADAAATGDMASTLGAFRAFGGSCGNCHDTYRVDND
jgi:cytochrome c556